MENEPMSRTGVEPNLTIAAGDMPVSLRIPNAELGIIITGK